MMSFCQPRRPLSQCREAEEPCANEGSKGASKGEPVDETIVRRWRDLEQADHN